MSMDGIRVDHAALATAAQDLMTAAKNIETRLDQLEGDLRPLESQWSGSAREAYRRAQQQWDQAIDEMVLLLRDVSRTVETSNADYRSADVRGAGRF